MLKELANDPYKYKDNFQSKSRRKFMIKYFENKLSGKLINIGNENPLCDNLNRKYKGK